MLTCIVNLQKKMCRLLFFNSVAYLIGPPRDRGLSPANQYSSKKNETEKVGAFNPKPEKSRKINAIFNIPSIHRTRQHLQVGKIFRNVKYPVGISNGTVSVVA